MNRATRLLILITTLALAAIATTQISIRRAPQWLPIDYGYDCRIGSQRVFVMENQKQFEDYLQEAFGRRRSHLRQDIPWDRVVLIALHNGPCMNTGYEIYTESVLMAPTGEVTVNYTLKRPGVGEVTEIYRNNPFQIIMLERPDGRINFAKKIGFIPMDVYYGNNPIYGFGCNYRPTPRCGCSCCSGNNEPRVLATEIYYPNLSNYFSGASAMPAIQWRTYKEGAYSKFKKFQTHIIHNDAQWQSYWRDAFGDLPQNAPRDIKWGFEQLVAIHVGEFATGGNKVYVESISRPNPSDITISYVVSSPASGTATSQALSQPWVIIRMDRPAGVIKFARRNVTQRPVPTGGKCNCGGKCGCKCCG